MPALNDRPELRLKYGRLLDARSCLAVKVRARRGADAARLAPAAARAAAPAAAAVAAPTTREAGAVNPIPARKSRHTARTGPAAVRQGAARGVPPEGTPAGAPDGTVQKRGQPMPRPAGISAASGPLGAAPRSGLGVTPPPVHPSMKTQLRATQLLRRGARARARARRATAPAAPALAPLLPPPLPIVLRKAATNWQSIPVMRLGPLVALAAFAAGRLRRLKTAAKV